MEKSIKTKPMFYAMCLPALQEIAIKNGYNLVLHGSLNRDMDLVAIPWIDNPSEHYEFLKELEKYLNGQHIHERYPVISLEQHYMYSILPGGRHSYVINVNRGGKFNGYTDVEYYIDISITPLPNK